MMKTIINNTISEIEVNRSRFITLLFKIKNQEEIKNIFDEVKNRYRDASHYCYAYIVDDNRKSSDDGEPGGTAGVPIMEVLLKRELNHVLCIVVRYFGGIKLGASGLVRAYSKAVTSALFEDNIVTLVPGYKIELIANYESQKEIDYLLKDYQVDKEYLDNIKYTIHLPLDKISILDGHGYDYHLIEKIDIEQK